MPWYGSEEKSPRWPRAVVELGNFYVAFLEADHTSSTHTNLPDWVIEDFYELEAFTEEELEQIYEDLTSF